MSDRKVIAVCLDAFDADLAERMMSEGKLKGLAEVKARSARFRLEHGDGHEARDTGLTGEHVATGLKPQSTNRWSAFIYNPQTYDAVQRHTEEKPFFGALDRKFLVFDSTYFDLSSCENGYGLVGWCGHDRGVLPHSRPEGLRAEIDAKFGPVPDQRILDLNAYSSLERTRALEAHILASARKRHEVADWLLTERFDDWDVALINYCEAHDGIEQFYHGFDPDGPASEIPSAAAARQALENIYEELSEGVAALARKFPDADLVVFVMHGMSRNETDVPSMALLPELMFRHQTGETLYTPAPEWLGSEAPLLTDDPDWSKIMIDRLDMPRSSRLSRLPGRAMQKLKRVISGETAAALPANEASLFWLPAYYYRPFWPEMKAFAFPSLFNGGVRVNLKGREKSGLVSISEYEALLDEIETLLGECTDYQTGRPIARKIKRPGAGDPLALCDTLPDLEIVWNGSIYGFSHPELGLIGPVPVRRVGGHTGGLGAMYVSGPDHVSGDYGKASSFDVAPTIVELLGARRPNRLDGESVIERIDNAQKVSA